MTTCPVCGHEVPDGEFCGSCGAHLPSGSARRASAFAADPGQHLLQPNLVSTLFPHLPHRHSTHVRIALLILLLVLTAMGALRLTGPAIAVAAAGVPLLYLLYLYEVQAYQDEPWITLGLTFGLGLLLGIPWAFFSGPFVARAMVVSATSGHPSWVFEAGVLIPLGAQLLMLVGPIALFLRGHHREPLDGFTFGVASALGFTLSTTFVELSPELQGNIIGGSPLGHALLILGRGLLVPFLNASTTGLITGALWFWRVPGRPRTLAWIMSPVVAVVVACIVRVAIGASEIVVLRLGLVVTLYLIVAAALLLWVRAALHAMLLVEGEPAAIGPEHPCPNCGRLTPSMRFCINCGVAMPATPYYVRTDPSARLAGRPRPGRRWAAWGGLVAVAAVVTAVIAWLNTPTVRPACGVLCTPPPPPCLRNCVRAHSGAPRASSVYRSSTYGFTVEYPGYAPSREDDRSVGWDLSAGSGQYSVDEVGGSAGSRTPEQVVNDVVSNNFSGYSFVYQVPGAEVGYSGGSGAVFSGETTSFFGNAGETRVVILAAVRGGLAIAVVGQGDAQQSSGDHPDPSGLPISGFVDELVNGTAWPP